MDFSQLSPEDFEYLVEDILKLKGFTITSRPARGPDRAMDMLAERLVTDDMRISQRERYLVQCKHLAQSKKNKSVLESDIPNFVQKAFQHNANRFLLVTSTMVSETVKDIFGVVNNDEKSGLKCAFMNKHDLIDYLQLSEELYNKYFGNGRLSWEAKARLLLNFLKTHQFEVHRGAMLWSEDITAVFGNDGFNEPRVQETIAKLKTLLKENQIPEIVTVVCDDGFSWVMLIKSANALYYHNKIWEFYPIDEDFKRVQLDETFRRMWTHWDQPFSTEFRSM